MAANSCISKYATGAKTFAFIPFGFMFNVLWSIVVVTPFRIRTRSPSWPLSLDQNSIGSLLLVGGCEDAVTLIIRFTGYADWISWCAAAAVAIDFLLHPVARRSSHWPMLLTSFPNTILCVACIATWKANVQRMKNGLQFDTTTTRTLFCHVFSSIQHTSNDNGQPLVYERGAR